MATRTIEPTRYTTRTSSTASTEKMVGSFGAFFIKPATMHMIVDTNPTMRMA
ncbi:hypothetical protein D3C73_1499520 [compost metagenome]